MSVAAGVPVLSRTEDLQRFLNSVPSELVDTVYIADNGKTRERSDLYQSNYPYKLEVLDLEYDIGIGACRRAIAAELVEDYLVVADNDMELPPNIDVLKTILDLKQNLGGVSGILLENDSIRSGCRDLFEDKLFGGGQALVRGIRDEKPIQTLQGVPLAKFDYITNAAMIRQECIDDYSWDSKMKDKEHDDFYIGHYHRTDWEFAVCPEVLFRHHKGGSDKYIERFRKNHKQLQKADERLCEKWGYDRIMWGNQMDWITTQHEKGTSLKSILKTTLPTKYKVLLSGLIA